MRTKSLLVAVTLGLSMPTAEILAQQEDVLDRLLEISAVSRFAWSPQGDRIAYVSNSTGTGQVYLLDIETLASRQLTSQSAGAVDPQWSPDGQNLIYLTDPGWQERYEVWLYRLDGGGERRILSDVGAIQRNVRWSPDSTSIVLETDAGGNFDIAQWSERDPVLRPLIAGPAGESSPEWSPDGNSISFLSRGSIWKQDIRGGEPQQLVSPGLGAAVQLYGWSPGGDRLLFVTDVSGYWNIGIYSIAENSWRYLAPEEHEQSEPVWSPDGRKVAFVSTRGFDKRLVVADLDTGGLDVLTPEGMVASSPEWNASGDRLGYLLSSPRQTADLWVSEQGNSRQLTDSMAGWRSEDFAAPEAHSYSAREGFAVPGLLYKPVNSIPGRRYPAVIVIHGGFYGQWIHDFDLLGQYLLRQGMVLFYPNPRGGGGQGRMYERLNDGDWGGGDVDDLIRAHDYIKTLPYVDANHIAIWGGSYGGYLVYSLVTTVPERFQAAVVRAGISDLRTQVTERIYSPVRLNDVGGYPRQIGGMPDDNPDYYRERSPITWVDKVRTPMLILHGQRDNRVAPGQSRIWTEALEENKVPVTLIEYPAEDHSLLRYKSTMRDQLQNITRLFERYLDL